MRAWTWLGLALATSCGARSALLEPGASAGGGDAGPSPTAPVSDAGAPDVASDASPDATVPPSCVLGLAGPPIEILSFADRHATAPSLVTLEPGSSSTPAKVALQAFASGGNSPLHSDIELLRLRVETPWPDGTSIEQGPTPYGHDAHGWGELSQAADAPSRLVLGWHGDPNDDPRVLLRFFDSANWKAAATSTVDPDGEAVLDLQPGASVGGMGFGYADNGYAIVWRSVDYQQGNAPSHPVVAVLDDEGSVVLAPKSVAPSSDYPGVSPSVIWSGTTYLMATGFSSCELSDPLCVPGAVAVTALHPASGDLVDDSHVEMVGAIKAHLPNAKVGRPSLAAHAGRVFVAWRESAAKDPPAFDALRVAELDGSGHVIAGPVDFGASASAQSRVTLSASDLGLVATYAEDGNPAASDTTLGRSRIVVHHLGFDLTPKSNAVVINATRFETYRPPETAPLASPRGVLLTWAGMGTSKKGGYWVTYLARLDCMANAPPDAGTADQYTAIAGPPTALERFMLTKYDPARKLCFRVHVAAPMDAVAYAVTAPDPWAVEKITVQENAASCDGFGDGASLASGASGTLVWTDPPLDFPCVIDANLVLDFPGLPPEPFAAQGLFMQGGWGCDGG